MRTVLRRGPLVSHTWGSALDQGQVRARETGMRQVNRTVKDCDTDAWIAYGFSPD